jgi:hypothetical protein
MHSFIEKIGKIYTLGILGDSSGLKYSQNIDKIYECIILNPKLPKSIYNSLLAICGTPKDYCPMISDSVDKCAFQYTHIQYRIILHVFLYSPYIMRKNRLLGHRDFLNYACEYFPTFWGRRFDESHMCPEVMKKLNIKNFLCLMKQIVNILLKPKMNEFISEDERSKKTCRIKKIMRVIIYYNVYHKLKNNHLTIPLTEIIALLSWLNTSTLMEYIFNMFVDMIRGKTEMRIIRTISIGEFYAGIEKTIKFLKMGDYLKQIQIINEFGSFKVAIFAIISSDVNLCRFIFDGIKNQKIYISQKSYVEFLINLQRKMKIKTRKDIKYISNEMWEYLKQEINNTIKIKYFTKDSSLSVDGLLHIIELEKTLYRVKFMSYFPEKLLKLVPPLDVNFLKSKIDRFEMLFINNHHEKIKEKYKTIHGWEKIIYDNFGSINEFYNTKCHNILNEITRFFTIIRNTLYENINIINPYSHTIYLADCHIYNDMSQIYKSEKIIKAVAYKNSLKKMNKKTFWLISANKNINFGIILGISKILDMMISRHDCNIHIIRAFFSVFRVKIPPKIINTYQKRLIERNMYEALEFFK